MFKEARRTLKKGGRFGRFARQVVKIESGANKNPTIETLSKIAKALSVGVDDLIK